MTMLSDLQQEEARCFFRELSSGERVFEYPTEFDQSLKELSRKKIACFLQEHGHAWLGRINAGFEEGPILREHLGEIVYNFDANFIVPLCDGDLVALIERWRSKIDIKALDAIHHRIKQLGGYHLHWV